MTTQEKLDLIEKLIKEIKEELEKNVNIVKADNGSNPPSGKDRPPNHDKKWSSYFMYYYKLANLFTS